MVFDISQNIANILDATPFLMKIPSFWLFWHTFGLLEKIWDISVAPVIHLPHDINWYNRLSDFEAIVFDIFQDNGDFLYLTLFLMKIPSFWIFWHIFGPLEQILNISIVSIIHLSYDINWYNGLSDFEYMVFDISQDIANILNLTPFSMEIPSFWLFWHTFGLLEKIWDISIAPVIHLPNDINWYSGLSDFEAIVFDIFQDIGDFLYLPFFNRD